MKISNDSFRILTLGLAAIGLVFAGCQVPQRSSSTTSATPPPPTTPAAKDRASEITRILELNAKGLLSDSDAAKLLRELTGAAEASNTVAVTTTPATVETTPPPPTPPAPAKPVVPAKPSVVKESNAQGLKVYAPEFALTGRLRSVGSDSMDKLMELWDNKFKVYHPNLKMIHEGKGSSTAIPALIENRSDLGPMSRTLKPEEIEKFKDKFGHEPLPIKVALDALAVYVHPDNPILEKGLTLDQLDAIFSSTRLQGYASDITTWGQLGLKGSWENQPIKVYSRNKASGTYGFFKDKVLKGGDFKPTNVELQGSAEVVNAVAADKYAIGYSGIGYITPQVRAVPIAKDSASAYVEATKANALLGKYPLSRFFYIVVNHNKNQAGSLNMIEFMRFVLSSEGQSLVEKDGYFALDQRLVDEELAKLE